MVPADRAVTVAPEPMACPVDPVADAGPARRFTRTNAAAARTCSFPTVRSLVTDRSGSTTRIPGLRRLHGAVARLGSVGPAPLHHANCPAEGLFVTAGLFDPDSCRLDKARGDSAASCSVRRFRRPGPPNPVPGADAVLPWNSG
ncbi:hypothetical protein [Streptomyces griseus]|uniref:hypothetical protein n=1 Tax=Streptomyces griseus TaxID=1911 RepID=UPI00131DACDD|nr:hypothetical protein [Streptomyces griseus]